MSRFLFRSCLAGVAVLFSTGIRGADASVSFEQQLGEAQAKSRGTTLKLTTQSAVHPGDSIIVTIALETADGAVTVTDSQNNSYALDAEATNENFAGTPIPSVHQIRTMIFSAHEVHAPEGTTITVTHPKASARSVSALSFRGLEVTDPLDRVARGRGISRTPSTAPTAPTRQTHELLVGAIGVRSTVDNTFSPDDGYNHVQSVGTSGHLPPTNVSLHTEYQVVSESGAFAAGGNLKKTAKWAAAIATYRADVTPPSSFSPADLADSSDSGISAEDNTTNATALTFTGTAEPYSRIVLINNTPRVELGSTDAGPTGSWSMSISLAEGVYVIAPEVIDRAGNASTFDIANQPEAFLNLVVDRTIQSLSAPDLEATSDSGTSDSDDYTNDATPTLSGTTERGAVVELLAGSLKLGNTTADESGDWTFTVPHPLADGDHSIGTRATDPAGNTGISETLQIGVDTRGPDVSKPDLSPLSDSGVSNSDDYTSDVTPSFVGTTESDAEIRTFIDGRPQETTTNDGFWSFTATDPLADGQHFASAVATDLAGNVVGSEFLRVIVDTLAPDVSTPDLHQSSDSGSSDSDDYTNDTTPTFLVSLDEFAELKLFVDGTEVGSGTGTGHAFTVPDRLNDGVRVVLATATDLAGNRRDSATLTVTIDTQVTAASIPDLDPGSDSGSSDFDDYTNDTTPTFVGTGELGADVTLLVDGQALGSTADDGFGDWSFTVPDPLTEARHFIKAEATDLAGNEALPSEELEIFIDTTGPQVSKPILDPASDSGFSNQDNYTNDTTPTLSGSFETGAQLLIAVNGQPLGGFTVDGGFWSFTPSNPLADGERSIVAEATDKAGNSNSSESLLVIIDTIAPDPPEVFMNDVTVDNQDAVPFFVTGEQGASVSFLVTDGSASIGGDGTAPLSTEVDVSTLADGTLTFMAKLTDAAGNTSAAGQDSTPKNTQG